MSKHQATETKRALVVLYHGSDENPVKAVAKNWRIPNKKVKHPFAWAAQIAVLTLHYDFYSNFMHMYEVQLSEENATDFIMNLRMQDNRKGVVAIWFSEQLEHDVNAWHEASRAIKTLAFEVKQAAEMQRKFLSMTAPFGIHFENAKVDLEALVDTINNDFIEMEKKVKSELLACSF